MSASLRRTREIEGRSTDQGTGPRHFLDLRDFDAATLRQMLDVAAQLQARAACRRARWPARRWR